MRLQDYLKENGISQRFVASKLGVSDVSVSNWCRGISRPTPDSIDALEKLTDGKVMLADWVAKTDGVKNA